MPTPAWKNNVLEMIGNTPIVRLQRVLDGTPGELYAKCEFLNPGGSVKDRIGRSMIEAAERSGRLKPGGTIIEATSGNTGVGLALAAAVKGYKTIFVMPDKMSEEKRQTLRAFGAKVVITPTAVDHDSPESYYSVAARLEREIPNSIFLDQYSNRANVDAHYTQTGPEIWAQTGGDFDALVVGMGTCGTITGTGRFLKEKKPSIRVIGVDPVGSVLKELYETGKHGEGGSYVVEGIGKDSLPEIADFSVIDEVISVEDRESFLMTRRLLTEEGIYAGGSCGSAVVGALKYLRSRPKPERVLVILPDSGNRYLSKIFNDAWMIEMGYYDRSEQSTLGTAAKVLGKVAGLPSVAPAATLEAAREVARAGRSRVVAVRTDGLGYDTLVGVLAGRTLETASKDERAEAHASRAVAFLEEDDTVEKARAAICAGKTALVFEGGAPKYAFDADDIDAFLRKDA